MKTKAATKSKKPQVKVRDLNPKKDARGGQGKLGDNHNETFVCDQH